ncbi:MAG: hypothetical protein A3J83_07160 [Elusimicrobia bacterium RIFOXYA2_FULL_40_6]|nr:MAG: hypothetical protein A3J83_07160 [Elusimicrobia bacterium RIFOXYA2_FULL_40_6]
MSKNAVMKNLRVFLVSAVCLTTLIANAFSLSISGYVRDISGAGISGAIVNLDSPWTTYTTGANGYYSFSVSVSSYYDIYATKTNYTFTPSGLSLYVSTNMYNQNFTGAYVPPADSTPPSAIATVNDGTGTDISQTTSATQLSANWTVSTDPESGLAGYFYAIGTTAGATNVVAWTNNGLATVVTKASLSLTSGQTYFFSVKAQNGAGLLSSVTSSNGQTVVIPPATYSITGQVSGASNVTLTLSGSASATTTSNSSGTYSFAGLVSGGNFTVTPSKTGFTFAPVSKSFSNLNSNQSAQNFIASAVVVNYTLTANVSPANSGSVTLNPAGGTYTAGTSVQVTATTNSGYTFANWSGDASGTSNSVSVVVNSNKSVTANFSVIQSTIITPPVTDTTPPTAPAFVRDGKGADINVLYFSSSTTLSANWDASTDPESGVVKYYSSIGTTPGGTDVRNWGVGSIWRSFQGAQVRLVVGKTYYVNVKAENGAGLQSAVTSSDGVTILKDQLAPGSVGVLSVHNPRIVPENKGQLPVIRYTLGGTHETDESKIVHVLITVYNSNGELVKTIVDKDMPFGDHSAMWNGKNFDDQITASGVYFVHIVAGDFKDTKKIVVVK